MHTENHHESEGEIRRLVGRLWTNGWLPLEIVRQIRRVANTTIADLVLVAIAADHNDRAPSTLDPRWVAQLDQLRLPSVPSVGWLEQWITRRHLSRDETGAAVTLLRGYLSAFRPVPMIVPPPGGASITFMSRGPTNDPMLARVRALLAQAESTTFEAEAETFTAKAQDLMTRHAIDAATLSVGSDRHDQPITTRVAIDDPYVSAKSTLLSCVARHSRCRVVLHTAYAMASIVGFANDVAATEVLFTSLLVQAQSAMRAATVSGPAGSHTRSRSFRSAFLTAYALRVGERLAEINASIVAEIESETGGSIVPVLVARSKVVDAAVDEMFGALRKIGSRRRFDGDGWVSGRLAADRARLNRGDLPAAQRSIASGM